MSISENITNIKKRIPDDIALVAVSKTKSVSDIQEAYKAGQRIFGENKVQELVEKYEQLPKDIQWHMIGHLQTNKVKYIIPFVSLIHGLDSIKLMKEINKRAKQHNRTVDCLIQSHIATESSKFGFSLDEIEDALTKSLEYQNINIVGLMGMGSFTSNEQQIKKEFQSLQSIFNKNHRTLSILSMGMSGDYKIAINCGSNMIRIGSTIFGQRN